MNRNMSLRVSAALLLGTATEDILRVIDVGSCSELCWLVYLILIPIPTNKYKHKQLFNYFVQ